VTNYGNKNVGNFTNIEEQNADWANTAAPPEAEKETTVGWGEENATEQIGSFDDVDKATTDAAPVAAPEKEKEKEKDKEEELPTKGLEEFLAEQNKRIEALAALLAQRNKETPSKAPGPRTIAQDESGGRYVEVHRLTNQLPKKPKPEKPAAEVAEPKAKKPATGEPETKKPLARPDIVFNVKKQFGRRYGKEDYIVFEEKEKQAKKNFKDYKKENKDKDSTAAKEGGEQQQTGEENTPAKEKNENANEAPSNSNRPDRPRRGGRQGGRGQRRGGGGGGRRNNNTSNAPRGNNQATGGTFSTDDWPALV